MCRHVHCWLGARQHALPAASCRPLLRLPWAVANGLAPRRGGTTRPAVPPLPPDDRSQPLTLPRRLLGTAFDPRSTWAIDACLLPRAARPGAAGDSGSTGGSASSSTGGSGSSTAGGSGAHEGVLFLDIVKAGQEGWRGDPADMERFTRWGYA